MEFRKMLMITLYAEQKKKKTDLQNSLLDSVGEGEGGMFQENSIETWIVSRVKQITSPGWMHETSARIWCTGKTQGEWVEREVGGGIGMGNTCKPMSVSFQCMTKFTTNKKKKSRAIIFPTKVCLVKAMVFPVVMYVCESLTIKKAEYQRMDAFKLWYWKRLLRVPWTARRSNQSILKEINPEYSLEELTQMLKFQYFGHLI